MKHKPIKFLGVLGVITTASFMGAGEASAIVALDTFDIDQELTDSDGGGSASGPPVNESDEALVNSILGGEREATLTAVSADADLRTGDFTPPGDVFILDNASFGEGTATLLYDGVGSTGLGGFDVTEGGDNSGLLFAINSISEEGELSVTIEDTSNNTSTGTKTFTASDAEVFFDFTSDFTGTPGANFASVFSVKLDVAGDGSSKDVVFDAIGFADPGETIPPAAPVPFEAETSIALALLGSWGAWKYWKKRRTQANDINSLS